MKAILVIEKPKDCEHCDLNIPFSKYNLSCQKTGYANGGDGSIPSYCPLKPLPKKVIESGTVTTYAGGVAYGWNACIEEIEK